MPRRVTWVSCLGILHLPLMRSTFNYAPVTWTAGPVCYFQHALAIIQSCIVEDLINTHIDDYIPRSLLRRQKSLLHTSESFNDTIELKILLRHQKSRLHLYILYSPFYLGKLNGEELLIF